MEEQEYIKIGQKLEVVALNKNPDIYYASYIKDLNNTEILIDIPSHKGKIAPIYSNDLIKLVVTTREAVYSSISSVLKAQTAPIAGMWVKTPTKFERIQRRAYLRVNVKIPINVEMVDKDGDALKFVSEIRDLSGGGISFFTNDDLNQYNKIGNFFVAISLPKEEKPIKTQADLVFCNKINPDPLKNIKKGNFAYIVAFKFTGLDDKTIDKICRFCQHQQIELKRRGLL